MATVMSLSGRVCLITGAGTGMYVPGISITSHDRGFVIAKVFGANESQVYITVCRLDVLEEATESVTGIPGSVVP